MDPISYVRRNMIFNARRCMTDEKLCEICKAELNIKVCGLSRGKPVSSIYCKIKQLNHPCKVCLVRPVCEIYIRYPMGHTDECDELTSYTYDLYDAIRNYSNRKGYTIYKKIKKVERRKAFKVLKENPKWIRSKYLKI